MNSTVDIKDHPAKFSDPIIDELRLIVKAEGDRLGCRPVVLDPFAGVGKIHLLEDVADTIGIELEPEWANAHPRTRVGDATDLSSIIPGSVHIWCSSICYGNRMADLYAGDPKGSTRYTYRIALGRDLSFNSAAGLQWGPEYRAFHLAAFREALRVLPPSTRDPDGRELNDGGMLIVNISNHYRDDDIMKVFEWTLRALIDLDCHVVEVRPVETQRMGNGANRDLRVDQEMIIVVRAPGAQQRLL